MKNDTITSERVETLQIYTAAAARRLEEIHGQIVGSEITPADAAEMIEGLFDDLNRLRGPAPRSTCAACNAVSDGPVPAYCSEHDGDYSVFLAMHNCD